MRVSVTEAKARLSELGGRAKAEDGVVLTYHSQPEVQLVPVQRVPIDCQARAAKASAGEKRGEKPEFP